MNVHFHRPVVSVSRWHFKRADRCSGHGQLDFRGQVPTMARLRIRKIGSFTDMYAIIETNGHQHKVTSGDTLRIDREFSGDEKTITFDRVLLVGGEGDARIGAPLVAGATVTADVIGPIKGPKIDIMKYKRRKGYHKKQGHRQPQVAVKITGIITGINV
jgi:large subunit ribosomal protein L21